MHPVEEYQNITLTVDGLNECNCDVHKKVGVELLYNSVKTGSQTVGDNMSWRQDAVEKASTQQREPIGPQLISWMSWRSDQLGIRRVGDKMR